MTANAGSARESERRHAPVTAGPSGLVQAAPSGPFVAGRRTRGRVLMAHLYCASRHAEAVPWACWFSWERILLPRALPGQQEDGRQPRGITGPRKKVALIPKEGGLHLRTAVLIRKASRIQRNTGGITGPDKEPTLVAPRRMACPEDGGHATIRGDSAGPQGSPGVLLVPVTRPFRAVCLHQKDRPLVPVHGRPSMPPGGCW